MKIIKWIVIGLCLLLTAFAGTAMLIGRALASDIPNQLPTMGLDMCGDNLCFGHVVPGVTTYSDAKRLLSQYITRDEEGHFHGNKDGYIEILVRTDWSGGSRYRQ